MAGKNTAVFGIYPSYDAVDRAVDALRPHWRRANKRVYATSIAA